MEWDAGVGGALHLRVAHQLDLRRDVLARVAEAWGPRNPDALKAGGKVSTSAVYTLGRV